MRWPWANRDKPEARESGGDFADAVVRLIESQAAGTAADSGSTAAVEAAAGALSRAMSSARVEGPAGAVEAVTGDFLGLVGRELGAAWAVAPCHALDRRQAPPDTGGKLALGGRPQPE